MKRIMLPVSVMRYAEHEKLEELGKAVLRENDDTDTIHFMAFGKVILEVRKEVRNGRA